MKFFEEVKGKRIKLNYWDDSDWFKPTKLKNNQEMIGIEESGKELKFIFIMALER